MKLATWTCKAATIAIAMIAVELRAQSPNYRNQQPTPAGNKYLREGSWNGPATSHWSGYGGNMSSNRTMAPNQSVPAHREHVIYEEPGVSPEGPGEIYDHEPIFEDGPGYPYSSGYWWRNGRWYAASDFVVWHRTRPFGLVIGFDNSFNFLPPPSTESLIPIPELNKNQTSMGVEPGNRTTIGYILMRDLDNRDHSIEATYLGFNEWDGHVGLISLQPRMLFTALDLDGAGFAAADFYDIFYQSQLHSLEIDYRIRNRPGRDRMIMGPDGFWSRQITPGRTQSVLFGLRGLSVDERWQWLSGRNGVNAGVYSGNMLINSDNNLLGVQVGGDCTDVHEGWYWGIRGAAGVYCNFAEGSYRLRSFDSQAGDRFVDSQAHNQSCAFMGELSFTFGWEITDHITLRSSYDFALIGGLVEASDQVSFDKYLAARVPSLNEGGQVFYNGLSVGLEAYW